MALYHVQNAVPTDNPTCTVIVVTTSDHSAFFLSRSLTMPQANLVLKDARIKFFNRFIVYRFLLILMSNYVAYIVL